MSDERSADFWEGYRAGLAEGQEERDALRIPFKEWLEHEEAKAVSQMKRKGHIFFQSPDGEEETCCMRCLISSPNAGQGCIEDHRDRYIKAENELRRLRAANQE